MNYPYREKEVTVSFPLIQTPTDFNKFTKFIDTEYETYKVKDDYKKQTMEDICNTKKKDLQNHQQFLARYIQDQARSHENANINTFQGLLVFHGMGSGKTCTSIAITEGLKSKDLNSKKYNEPYRTRRKILIVAPAQVIPQYEEDMKTVCSQYITINGKSQALTNSTDQKNIKKIKKDLEKLGKQVHQLELTRNTKIDKKKKDTLNSQITQIKKAITDDKNRLNGIYQTSRSKININYIFISHKMFINGLYKEDIETGKLTPGPMIENYLKHPNCTLIIDEIQNIVSAPVPVYDAFNKGIHYFTLLNALRYHAHSSLRLVLLSGTPIRDNPHQLGLTLNLFRPRLVFPLDRKKFESIFIDVKKGVFERVTHMKKENRTLFQYMCAGYISYLPGAHPNSYPTKNVHLVKVGMTQDQFDAYEENFRREVDKTKDPGKKGDNDLSRDFVPEIEGMNEVEARFMKTGKLEGDYGEPFEDISNINLFPVCRRISNIWIPKQAAQTEKSQINKVRDFLNAAVVRGDFIETLESYSPKFAELFKNLKKATGRIFIFSQYVACPYGVDFIALLLEIYGYMNYVQKLKGKKLRLCDLPSQSNETKGAYILWSGKGFGYNGQKELDLKNELLNTFNSPENEDGSIIRIVVGSLAIKEGISFKGIQQAHIMEPWWNQNVTNQIEARGVRFCSHINSKHKVVEIYKYITTLKGHNISNLPYAYWEDQSVEEYLMKISRIKQDLINEFLKAAKEVAVDCKIFRNSKIRRKQHIYSKPTEERLEGYTELDKLEDENVICVTNIPDNVKVDEGIQDESIKVNMAISLSKLSVKNILKCLSEDIKYEKSWGKFKVYKTKHTTKKKNKLIDKIFKASQYTGKSLNKSSLKKKSLKKLNQLLSELKK